MQTSRPASSEWILVALGIAFPLLLLLRLGSSPGLARPLSTLFALTRLLGSAVAAAVAACCCRYSAAHLQLSRATLTFDLQSHKRVSQADRTAPVVRLSERVEREEREKRVRVHPEPVQRDLRRASLAARDADPRPSPRWASGAERYTRRRGERRRTRRVQSLVHARAAARLSALSVRGANNIRSETRRVFFGPILKAVSELQRWTRACGEPFEQP